LSGHGEAWAKRWTTKGFSRRGLDALKAEGRYRVFADLERRAGQFSARLRPSAPGGENSPCGARTIISAWGQHPDVIAAMHEAIDKAGAGAAGTRNISGTTHYHVFVLEQELAALHQKQDALIFTSGYVAQRAGPSRLWRAHMPNCIVLSDAYKPTTR